MKRKAEKNNGYEIIPTPSKILTRRDWTGAVEALLDLPPGKSIRVASDNPTIDRNTIYIAVMRHGRRVQIKLDKPNHLILTLRPE